MVMASVMSGGCCGGPDLLAHALALPNSNSDQVRCPAIRAEPSQRPDAYSFYSTISSLRDARPLAAAFFAHNVAGYGD